MKSKSDLKINDIENIFKDRCPGAEGDFKFFSVLIPVIERKDGLYLLYEVRARHMVRQPGEVCFPGGELEQDESPRECALRETWEETGIDPAKVKMVNRLDTLYTYSNFAMYCYLGLLDEAALDDIKLSPNEVDEIFFVALDDLIKNEPEIYKTEIVARIPENFPYEKVTGGKEYNWRKGHSNVPVYDINGRIIWGLTARLTKNFIGIIKENI